MKVTKEEVNFFKKLYWTNKFRLYRLNRALPCKIWPSQKAFTNLSEDYDVLTKWCCLNNNLIIYAKIVCSVEIEKWRKIRQILVFHEWVRNTHFSSNLIIGTNKMAEETNFLGYVQQLPTSHKLKYIVLKVSHVNSFFKQEIGSIM